MGFSNAPIVTIDPVRVIPPDQPDPADPTEVGPLAPEIRFLDGIVADAALRDAERIAGRIGVTAEAVLLAEGVVSSEHYYRHLARFLGVPFAERPLRPAATARSTMSCARASQRCGRIRKAGASSPHRAARTCGGCCRCSSTISGRKPRCW